MGENKKDSNKERPLLICLSATRNYGWVTRAFCQANSQWADYIIIVDQMSTDGTREICAEYEKVILLDDHDLSYSESRRSIMALNRAREIKGDKILIYLAIDEVLPANWMNTQDGQRILMSKPTEMFMLDWANLLSDNKHCKMVIQNDMYRIFHDDGLTPYDNQNKDMHTHCLPYHKGGKEYKISDFPILHFGIYNTKFQYVKLRYYQMVDYDKNHRSAVTLSRYYNRPEDGDFWKGNDDIKPEWLWNDFNLFSLVDLDTPPLLVTECKKIIQEHGITRYAKLDMWDNTMLTYLQISDPRSWWIKILHRYLHKTEKYCKRFIIRAIDKILKQFV